MARAARFEEACLTAFFVYSTVAASMNPIRVVTGRAGLVYGAVMAYMVALIACSDASPENVLLTEGITLVIRACMAIRYHKMGLVVLWNTAYMVVSIYVLLNILGRARASTLRVAAIGRASHRLGKGGVCVATIRIIALARCLDPLCASARFLNECPLLHAHV